MILSSRPFTAMVMASAAALAAAAFGSCAQPPEPGADPIPIEAIEQIYQEVHALNDEIGITRSRGETTTMAGAALGDLVDRYNIARSRLQQTLATGCPSRIIRPASRSRRLKEDGVPALACKLL